MDQIMDTAPEQGQEQAVSPAVSATVPVEQPASPSVAELQSKIASLERQLRGLQSGADSQIARVRQELSAQIAELEAERNALYEEIMGRSAPEDQSKWRAQLLERQYRQRERALQQQLEQFTAERYISDVCARYKINRDDLPPSAFRDRESFEEAIREHLHMRAQPSQQRATHTPGPSQSPEASLEERIANRVLEALGGLASPTARGGASKTSPRNITEILKEEGFDAANRAVIAQLTGS